MRLLFSTLPGKSAWNYGISLIRTTLMLFLLVSFLAANARAQRISTYVRSSNREASIEVLAKKERAGEITRSPGKRESFSPIPATSFALSLQNGYRRISPAHQPDSTRRRLHERRHSASLSSVAQATTRVSA